MSKSIRFKGAGGTGGGSSTDEELIKTVSQVGHGLSVGDAIRVSGENTFAKSQANNSDNADVEGIVYEVISSDMFKFKLLGARISTAGAVPNEVAGTVLYLSASTAGLLTSTIPTGAGEIVKPVAKVSVQNSEMLTFNHRGEEIT